MSRIEKYEYKNYIAILEYQPFFDDSTPRSQQYNLKIEKDGKTFINRYRFTGSGAITFFHRWVDKKLSKSDL